MPVQLQEYFLELYSVLFGATLGCASFLIAEFLVKLIVKKREGTPITWTKACGDTIKPLKTKYPFAYIVIAALFMSVQFYFNGMSVKTLYVFLELSMLLAISITDIKYRLIPNVFVLSIILIHFVWVLLEHFVLKAAASFGSEILTYFIGLAVCFVAFFAGALVTGGNVGMGDVKLAMAIGFMLGWRFVLIAIALSGIVIFPIIVLKPGPSIQFKMKQLIPFGPPFSFSAMIALVWMLTPTLSQYISFPA